MYAILAALMLAAAHAASLRGGPVVQQRFDFVQGKYVLVLERPDETVADTTPCGGWWLDFVQCVRAEPDQDVLTGPEGPPSVQEPFGDISLLQELQQRVPPAVQFSSSGNGTAFTLQSSSSELLSGMSAFPFEVIGEGSVSLSQVGELALVTAVLGTLMVVLFILSCFLVDLKPPRKPALAHVGSPQSLSDACTTVSSAACTLGAALRPHGQEMCRWVEKLPVCSSQDVVRTVRPRGGFDNLQSQPQEAGGAMRVEGRVVAVPQAELSSPLTGRRCVLFSASVSETRLDGVPAPPLAFSTSSTDFEIELRDSLRIRVSGQDVALFDMVGGMQQEQACLREAAEHLQAFLYTSKSPVHAGAPRASGGASLLDFTECLLCVDAMVTCIGELRRDSSGMVWLRPLQELGGAHDTCMEKVMVSDDPSLLQTAQ